MAIIDVDFMMSQSKGLTSSSGIDALTHALEAYASIMATDYTDGIALKAVQLIFDYLPSAYENGAADPGGQGEDGKCLHPGRYGLCQCVSRHLPLHGA